MSGLGACGAGRTRGQKEQLSEEQLSEDMLLLVMISDEG